MMDRRRLARAFWDLFPGCTWCHNTKKVTLDRTMGEVQCPFCKEES